MGEIVEIKKKVDIKIEKDRLKATVFLTELEIEESLEEENIVQLLENYGITFGILPWNEMDWKQILQDEHAFTIAEGLKPRNGKNGRLIAI